MVLCNMPWQGGCMPIEVAHLFKAEWSMTCCPTSCRWLSSNHPRSRAGRGPDNNASRSICEGARVRHLQGALDGNSLHAFLELPAHEECPSLCVLASNGILEEF
eukprot:393479-Pelagomonas_calceolata.AAC.10